MATAQCQHRHAGGHRQLNPDTPLGGGLGRQGLLQAIGLEQAPGTGGQPQGADHGRQGLQLGQPPELVAGLSAGGAAARPQALQSRARPLEFCRRTSSR